MISTNQLWWGHEIPVWYRGDETHVGAAASAGEGWEHDRDAKLERLCDELEAL